MQKFHEVENVELIGLHSSGKSIGKWKNRNVFLEGGIPGEIANLSIAKRQKKAFLEGSISKIINASGYRQKPACKHFVQCGGCNWMHIQYPHQLELKRQVLNNALDKYEIKVDNIHETFASPNILAYRNKLDFAFANVIGVNGNSSVILGFHPSGNPQQVFKVEECSLMDDKSIEVCEFIEEKANDNKCSVYDYQSEEGILRGLTLRKTLDDKWMLILQVSDNTETVDNLLKQVMERFSFVVSVYCCVIRGNDARHEDYQYIHVAGEKYIFETLDEIRFRISPQSFFQPNPVQAANIFKKIAQIAEVSLGKFVYDLYTGVGTIPSFLSKHGCSVLGIEGNKYAIEDAKYSAEANGFNSLRFMVGDILETFTRDFVDKHGKADIVILDPPRSGTLMEIKKAIVYAEPETVIYLSCNPVSLAWDLKFLSEFYDVKELWPYDMFPNTHHVETLALLKKKH